MTFRQNCTVWELRRQGYQVIADEADAHWKRGEIFSPDPRIRLSSRLAACVKLCNQEFLELNHAA
jgi:hypothetical protein